MARLAIPFPEIDPVAAWLGRRWSSGTAWPMASCCWGCSTSSACCGRIGWWNKRLFAPDKADDLLLYMTIGVSVGGRWTLFDEPGEHHCKNRRDPASGSGMAFHGGLVGSIVAIVLFVVRNSVGAWTAWTRAR